MIDDADYSESILRLLGIRRLIFILWTRFIH